MTKKKAAKKKATAPPPTPPAENRPDSPANADPDDPLAAELDEDTLDELDPPEDDTPDRPPVIHKRPPAVRSADAGHMEEPLFTDEQRIQMTDILNVDPHAYVLGYHKERPIVHAYATEELAARDAGTDRRLVVMLNKEGKRLKPPRNWADNGAFVVHPDLDITYAEIIIDNAIEKGLTP